MLTHNSSWKRCVFVGVLSLATLSPAVGLMQTARADQDQTQTDKPHQKKDQKKQREKKLFPALENAKAIALGLSDLTDEQKSSLNDIFVKAAQDQAALQKQFRENKTDKDQRQAEIAAFVKKVLGEVRGALTPEQVKQFNEALAAKRKDAAKARQEKEKEHKDHHAAN